MDFKNSTGVYALKELQQQTGMETLAFVICFSNLQLPGAPSPSANVNLSGCDKRLLCSGLIYCLLVQSMQGFHNWAGDFQSPAHTE